MFKKLGRKWNVNGLQLVLILCTFAIGGSLTGFLGKRIMDFIPIESNALWLTVYIALVTLIWPFMVLFVSILFGQYRFFTGYLKKMGQRMGFGKKAEGSLPNEKKKTISDY